MRDYFMKDSPIRFSTFIDGDCVNDRDGEAIDGGILLPLTVEAPAGHEVTVNALPAAEAEPGRYTVSIPLRGYRNAVLAEDKTDGTECRINLSTCPKRWADTASRRTTTSSFCRI